MAAPRGGAAKSVRTRQVCGCGVVFRGSSCADELGADLIVVGSHGDTGYQPLSLGSTAARVGLCAAPPVLVVPPERRRAEYLVTAEQRAVR